MVRSYLTLLLLIFAALTGYGQSQRFQVVIVVDTLSVTGKVWFGSNVAMRIATPSRVMIVDAAGNLTNSTVTPTELLSLAGATGTLNDRPTRTEISGSNFVFTASIDSISELEALIGGVDLIVGTEMDTATEFFGIMPDFTGSGNAVRASSPTIVTPIIASFANATHTHQNAAGGGTLDAAAIAAGTIATSRLGSGTANSSTYLRGDSTWASVAGSGDGDGFPLDNDGDANAKSITNIAQIQLNNALSRGITNLSGVAPKLVLNGPGVIFWTPTNETILDIVPLNSTNATYALVSITQTGAVHNQTISNALAFRNLPLVMLPDGENLFLVWWDPNAQTNKIFSYQTLTNTYTGTGSEVRSNAPTISTPTLLIPIIASFASATHTHQNAAGGGTLDAAAIAAGTLGTARLGSGTADDNGFLRGDSTWVRSTTDGQMLRLTAGVLGFGALDLADADAVTGVLPDGNVATTLVRTSRQLTMAGTTFEVSLSAGAQDLSADRTWTFGFDRTARLAGDPALIGGSVVFGTNGIVYEGLTANTFEGLDTTDDITADRTWTKPDRSGTYSLSGDTFTGNVTGTLDADGSTALTVANSSIVDAMLNLTAPALAAATATTPAADDNSTRVATTAYVQTELTNYFDYIWIPAGAMTPVALNSAAIATNNPSGADGASYDVYAFDDTTVETNTATFALPENWDAGTFKVKPHWTSTSGSGTVAWGFRIGTLRNDDAYGAVLGTQQTSVDTLIANNDHHVGPATAAITAGGTPAVGAMMLIQTTRETGSDTKTGDALLKGIMIEYTRKTLKVAGW